MSVVSELLFLHGEGGSTGVCTQTLSQGLRSTLGTSHHLISHGFSSFRK